MATVNTTVDGGGGAQQASFSVEPDRIPAMIAKYEDAKDELDQILKAVSQSSRLKPPGDDEVSKSAAKAVKDLMGSTEGITKVVTDARNHLQHQIEQLKAAQQNYRAADEAATPNEA